MKKALYVPCYPGELGWELINYIPHVNYRCNKIDYNEIHIVVRKGREALYPMGTHFYPISLSTKKSMGNNGPAPPPNDIASRLKKRFDVDSVKNPGGGCHYIKKRKFFKYTASDKSLAKWSHIPSSAVTLCVRGRKFGPHKNWSPKNWVKLCEYILNKGFIPVITGLKELVVFDPPDKCIDLLSRTTFEDLIAIMQKSRFVTGQSTGPAHLASLCGVPHAIWGSSRIKERYKKSWNPHKTMVEYHCCRNQFECSFEEAVKLVDRIINRLEPIKCV